MIFCVATLGPRVFVEIQTLEEVVELETETMDVYAQKVEISFVKRYAKLAPYVVKKSFITNPICTVRKEYLHNCSLTYYG